MINMQSAHCRRVLRREVSNNPGASRQEFKAALPTWGACAGLTEAQRERILNTEFADETQSQMRFTSPSSVSRGYYRDSVDMKAFKHNGWWRGLIFTGLLLLAAVGILSYVVSPYVKKSTQIGIVTVMILLFVIYAVVGTWKIVVREGVASVGYRTSHILARPKGRNVVGIDRGPFYRMRSMGGAASPMDDSGGAALGAAFGMDDSGGAALGVGDSGGAAFGMDDAGMDDTAMDDTALM